MKKWKKYTGPLKGVDFLKALNAVKGYEYCFSCPHSNGECEDFARQGTCKAYGIIWKTMEAKKWQNQ